MSVTAGRPTEVRNAAVATLADLDRELRAVETERERAAAVAWLEEAFDAFVESRVPGRFRQMTPGQVKLAEEYAWRVSRASNYPRPMAAVAYLPGVDYTDSEGRNIYDEAPAEDAATWPVPASGCEVSDADDFRDGMTPSERRERTAEEARAAAAERARRAHIDLLGPPVPAPGPGRFAGRLADVTIIDDPTAWEIRRSNHFPPGPAVVVGRPAPVLERLRDALRPDADARAAERVAVEVRDDAATNGRRVRVTLDGQRWHELSWSEGEIAISLMQEAARRNHAPRLPAPPPPPPPARWRWSADFERAANPDLADVGSRLLSQTAAMRELAELEDALVQLRAIAGPSLRGFEYDFLRSQLRDLEQPQRVRTLETILQLCRLGQRVDWSTIVEDVRVGRPWRNGVRLNPGGYASTPTPATAPMPDLRHVRRVLEHVRPPRVEVTRHDDGRMTARIPAADPERFDAAWQWHLEVCETCRGDREIPAENRNARCEPVPNRIDFTEPAENEEQNP